MKKDEKLTGANYAFEFMWHDELLLLRCQFDLLHTLGLYIFLESRAQLMSVRKYRQNNFWKLAYRLLSKDLVVYTNIKSPIMYITTMYRFVFKKLFIILQFIDPIKILYYKVVKQALNKQVYFYIWSLWTWSLEKAKILFLFESRKQRS